MYFVNILKIYFDKISSCNPDGKIIVYTLNENKNKYIDEIILIYRDKNSLIKCINSINEIKKD